NVTYYWSVQAIDGMYAGGPWASEQSFTYAIVSVVAGSPGRSLALESRPTSGDAISFQLQVPEDGYGRLQIYDLSGRRVAMLLDGPIGEGQHTIEWKPQLGRGLYFARLALGRDAVVAK